MRLHFKWISKLCSNFYFKACEDIAIGSKERKWSLLIALLLAVVLTQFARLNECCKKAQFPAKYLNDGFMLDSLWNVCPTVKQSRNLQHISPLRWWLDQSKTIVNQKDKSTAIGSVFVWGVWGLALNLGNKVERTYLKIK